MIIKKLKELLNKYPDNYQIKMLMEGGLGKIDIVYKEKNIVYLKQIEGYEKRKDFKDK